MESMTSFMLLVFITSLTFSSGIYQQRRTGTIASVSEYQSTSTFPCTEDGRSVNCDGLSLMKVPNNLPANLHELSLRNNNIKSLLNISFSNYLQMMQLHLEDNDIQDIESGTFVPLKFLQYLNIDGNNHLGDLKAETVLWGQHLSSLSIQFCGLESFTGNVRYATREDPLKRSLILQNSRLTRFKIACNPDDKGNFEIISLAFNNLKQIILDTFQIDCEVDFLDLAGNPLLRIDPDSISSLHMQFVLFGRLDYVREGIWTEMLTGIAKSQIKGLGFIEKYNVSPKFPPDFFGPLYNFSFFELEISYATLENRSSLLSNLNGLSKLTIHRDIMNILEPYYFAGMDALEILHLESNEIKVMNPFKFMWLIPNLRELYLCDNGLSILNGQCFHGLKNLVLLNLANNKFLSVLYIPVLGYRGLSNLQYLNMSGTSLSTLVLYEPTPLLEFVANDVEADMILPLLISFKFMKSLEYLNFAHSSYPMSNILISKHNTSIFNGMKNLTYLSLKDNVILKLLSGTFQGLSALQFLDLSQCQISYIESNVFQGLISLHTLSLADNYLQQIPINIFHIDLVKLTMCNLTNSKLNYLDNQMFANTKSMKTLLLSNNDFTDFNQSTFAPIMATITSIDISDNQLVCNCDLSWLVKWLNGNVTILNDNNTVCATSSTTLTPLKGKPLMAFTPRTLCGPNIALICSIPFATVGLIAMMCFVYRNRWLIRHKLYLLKLAVLGYQEILDAREHGEFEFDINVMFMEEDEQWVQEHLRPILEERLPHFNRTAIGDEDLILGMHYIDAVCHVIDKSFKTVFLLSRVAFHDNWFMTKFRIAFDQVRDSGLENVVVIFLEDIPDDEFPFLVRLYLSERRTYLWWVDDERGQEYFWNELILTLQRDNMRWNNMIPPE